MFISGPLFINEPQEMSMFTSARGHGASANRKKFQCLPMSLSSLLIRESQEMSMFTSDPGHGAHRPTARNVNVYQCPSAPMPIGKSRETSMFSNVTASKHGVNLTAQPGRGYNQPLNSPGRSRP